MTDKEFRRAIYCEWLCGLSTDCGVVGVHDGNGNYEGIFVDSTQGKDSGGSLEGGVVRKHDPLAMG